MEGFRVTSKAPEPIRFLIFDSTQGIGSFIVAKQKLQKVDWLIYFQGRWGYRESALSPDGRWLYLAMDPNTAVLDIKARKLHWLGRAKVDPDGAYTPEVYYLIWSPNSRYLLGNTGGDAGDLVLCTPPRLGYRTLVEKGVRWFGWYPDSQRVWYTIRQKGTNPRQDTYYQLSLKEKHAHRLSEAEIKRIHTQWDFLCEAFRWSSMDLYHYKYTADLTIRVKYRLTRPPDVLYVEWRDGRRCMLQIPKEVHRPGPLDISADKQWLLVRGGEAWNDYYVVHITTGSWERVFSASEQQAWSVYAPVLRVDFAQSARLL